MLAVHAAVLPLDGEGALVTDLVEGADDLLEIDAPAAEGPEIPVAVGMSEVDVAAEHPGPGRPLRPPYVLHVHVVDAVPEVPDEPHVVHALVAEVAGVVVEAESLAVAQGIQRPLGRGDVEGDFRGMHLQPVLHAHLVEHVQDGVPARREVIEPGVDGRRVHGRKRVEQVPDRRTGESVDHAEAHVGGRPGGQFHLFGRALPHAFRVPVAPDVGRENRFVTGIDQVADGLAGEVVADGEDLQAVLVEQRVAVLAVGLALGALPHVEVISPAGQFETVEPPARRLPGEGVQREVRPLAGE